MRRMKTNKRLKKFLKKRKIWKSFKSNMLRHKKLSL